MGAACAALSAMGRTWTSQMITSKPRLLHRRLHLNTPGFLAAVLGMARLKLPRFLSNAPSPPNVIWAEAAALRGRGAHAAFAAGLLAGAGVCMLLGRGTWALGAMWGLHTCRGQGEGNVPQGCLCC